MSQRGQQHPVRAAMVAALDRAVPVAISLLWLNEEAKTMKWYMLIPPLWAVVVLGCMGVIAWRDARKPKSQGTRIVEVLGTFHPRTTE